MSGDLEHELRRVRMAIDNLRDRVGIDETHALAEPIQTLSSVVEELEVASEELSHQNEELRAVRRELEQRSRDYWALFQFAPDAYVVTNSDTTIRRANGEAGRLMAMPAGALEGMALAMFVPEAERRAFRRRVLEIVGGGDAVEWEFPMTPHGRTAVLVAAQVVPAAGVDGSAQLLRWTLRDVTQARRAQEALQDAYAQATEQYEQLRDVDHWKDAFLAAAAHDIRSPLTVIVGAAETLIANSTLDADSSRALLSSIVAKCRDLDALLTDLLDLDRFTRGGVRVARVPADLYAIARTAVETVDAAGHPVELEQVGSGVTAEVEPRRVEQIVANLVRNAVRHTPAGTPIRVTVSRHDDRARIVVEDGGPGVPTPVRDSMFLPFVTMSAHDEDRSGTGIGLSLVELFAELHGGSVRLESGSDGGARFVVDLPDAT